MTYLALELLDLEAVKVGQRGTGLAGGDLLSPGGLVPLGDNIRLGQVLLDDLFTSTTGKILDDQRSQSQVVVREGLTSNTGGRTIDESL